MALLILVGRRSVSHSPMRYDLVTRQSIKEWHKLGLGSSLASWVVETLDGAITSPLLAVLSPKSIDACNSYGQILVRYSYQDCFMYNLFTKLTNRVMLCHDRFVKFKTNK